MPDRECPYCNKPLVRLNPPHKTPVSTYDRQCSKCGMLVEKGK